MFVLFSQVDSVLVRSFVFVGMALHRDVAINLEKPTAPVMKFPIFYEARSVIACFKRA
jgi:hypothetical protein